MLGWIFAAVNRALGCDSSVFHVNIRDNMDEGC